MTLYLKIDIYLIEKMEIVQLKLLNRILRMNGY